MFERNVGLQLFEGNIESEHIHFLGTEQAQPRTLRQRINQTAYDPLVQSARYSSFVVPLLLPPEPEPL